MRRIAYYGLIEVPYLDINIALGVGDWAEIADVTVSANPYRWPARNLFDVGAVESFIKLPGVAPHVCMRRAGHLTTAAGGQEGLPFAKFGKLENFPFHSKQETGS
jgi:hypothetical protein